MPIIDVDQLEAAPTLGLRPDPQEPEENNPAFKEVIKAAFRTENTIGSAIAGGINLSQPNDSFDPFDSIEGYEQYATSFVNSNTPEDVQETKDRIDRENADKKLLQEAGWMGVAAGFAAGVLDPVNLIPVGGSAAKAYTMGGSILKGAANTARAGFLGSTVAETALHATQETRTLEESAANIAGATLLSGILGGAAGAIGGGEIMRLGKRVEQDLVVPHPDAPDMAEPNSIVIGGSVGAAAVRNTTIAEETLSNAWGVDKAFARLNPKLRLATSASVESRRFAQDLVETPFYYEKNDAGIANPIAIESLVGIQDARMGRAVEQQSKVFTDYKKRIKADGEKSLSYLEFRQEVAKALRRNDTHAIPEVAQIAQVYRKEVFNPLKDAAVSVKLLPENVKVSTADSYLHRWWDKHIVAARRNDLHPILTRGLQAEYQKIIGKFDIGTEIKSKNIQSEMDELKDSTLRDDSQFLESAGSLTEQEIFDAIKLLETPPKKPETLISFLHKNGGLKESAGELRHIGLTNKARVGFVNKNGMNLDDATLKAWENGFFPKHSERPEIEDLLDAIREDFVGNLVVRQEDTGYAHQLEALSDVQRALDEIGVDTEKFKGIRRITPDINLNKIKERINKIQGERRAGKVTALEAKLGDLKSSRAETRATELEMSDDEFSQLANDIIDNMLGGNDIRIPYDLPIAARGPLKDRLLNFVRDEDVESFLVNDIEAVARRYVRTMAPDIAIKERFGDLNILGADGIITQKINEDYQRLVDGAKTEKERKLLAKRRDSDLKDIDALISQIRGTYGMPDNPDSLIVRGGRAIRQIQYASKLGGMTASAFADVARPVMVHGIMNTFQDGIIPLITNFKGLKLSAREVKEAGAAWDMVLDSRAMTMAEVNDPYVQGNKFEKGLQALTGNFGKITLMTQWNTGLKQFSGVVTQGRIVKAVAKSADGTVTKKDARYLNMIGIDSDMAKRIAKEIAAHGEDVDKVKVVNTGRWKDLEAQRAYRTALKKEVDRIIVTPGAGDLPLLLKSTEAGKMIGQFRSFSFAATNKMLIAGLQERDLQTLNGWVLAVGMGMVSYAFKTWDRGGELSEDPRVWVQEGIDRSGVLAILSEINQISNKVSRGTVSLNALAGAPPLTRYASSNMFGVLAGPTVGTVADVAQVVGSAANGEWTPSDSRALRRMIPYQNLMLARQLFDQVENSLNTTLGAEE